MITPYTPDPFELEVADRIIGKTILKQKVRFLRLEHDDAARTATVHILVIPHAVAEDGSYGPVLATPPFRAYNDEIVASNSRLVDTRDGTILAERYKKADGSAGTDADWQADIARIEADATLPAMYQGDYFLYLRDNQPLVIGNVIRQYIEQADAAPSRFA